MNTFDVIVIGAGHAGIEAALAAARMGCKTLIFTLKADTIGLMSCNPAIGGVGKGQLVKEIDAIGGQMARAADACGIQFRILNASKGSAVQSSRAQIDRNRYVAYMQEVLRSQRNLTIAEGEVEGLIVEGKQVQGVMVAGRGGVASGCVVLAPGTFLSGLIHVGLVHFEGGRINERSSIKLAADLKERGFSLLRFKTGTCPRLNKATIDFKRLIPQHGDEPPKPFSFATAAIERRQVACHITYTNARTHRIIADNLDKSPLYTGVIKSTGVRYCPSIEDKVVKFSDRQRHQVFLEPDGSDSPEVYPNGLATSLPEEVQIEMLHSIDGLEEAEVVRFGYGIEHTVVEPTQLFPTLETKLVQGLFLAGQINGTTGYEEAAAQGLVAGINAAGRVQGRERFILDRATGYIGVLIDDLTTKGTAEPYRMFTSRVEYRLIVREDNADMRLRKFGRGLGLVGEQDYRRTLAREEALQSCLDFLRTRRVRPSVAVNEYLCSLGTAGLTRSVTLEELLRRPQLRFEHLAGLDHGGSEVDAWKPVAAMVENEVKYAGFIQRQRREVERFKNLEKIRLFEEIDYAAIAGLSREIREKLSRVRPMSLGQASRISGVTPAAVSILMVYLKKHGSE